ncbi:MAG: nucleotidyltransferase domain-containing protein [Deltaproteobacteria bacterium]
MNLNSQEQIALKGFSCFLSGRLADNYFYSCLFGSKARGDAREDSDLAYSCDIMKITDMSVPLMVLMPAAFTSAEVEGGMFQTLKIRQIEPEFLSSMFTVEGGA